MDNRKIVFPETTPETVSAHRVAGTAPPIYRARRGTRGLEILYERTGWAKKPSMHVVLGRIKPTRKRGDNPRDPRTLGLCRT
jgi:hypothetical protein